jgi:hypothetical protein
MTMTDPFDLEDQQNPQEDAIDKLVRAAGGDPAKSRAIASGKGSNHISLPPDQEKEFQSWYKGWSSKAGIDPNPDNPLHKYDYRAAYKAGVIPKIDPLDKKYHFDSRFKDDDHPNRFVNGVDTKYEDSGLSGMSDQDLANLSKQLNLPSSITDPMNESAPARFVKEMGTRGAEQIRGGADLAGNVASIFLGNPRQQQDSAYNLLSGVVSPMGDQLSKASTAAQQGNYGEAAARGVAGVVPVVGPWVADLVDRIRQDPLKGSADAVTDALTLLLGQGGESAGTKLGAVDTALPPEVIPGARRMAAENPTGPMRRLSQVVAKSPLSANDVQGEVLRRNIPVTKNLLQELTNAGPEMDVGQVIKDRSGQSLLNDQEHRFNVSEDAAKAFGGQLQDKESVGKMTRQALSDRFFPSPVGEAPRLQPEAGVPPSVGDLESALHEPIRAAGDELAPVLDNTKAAAAKLKKESSGSRDLIASNLKPATLKMIDLSADVPTETGPASLGGEANVMSAENQEVLRSLLGDAPESEAPTLNALRDARRQVQSLIKADKTPGGSPNTHALGLLDDAMKADIEETMRRAGILEDYKKANKMSVFKHDTFDQGITGDILKRKGDNPLDPSQIVDRVASVTPEEARNFRRGIGNNAQVQAEVKTAITRELFGRSASLGEKGKVAINYEKAAAELASNHSYKELLGENGYNSLMDEIQSNMPTQAKQDALRQRAQYAKEDPEKIVAKILRPNNETEIQNITRTLKPDQKAGLHRASLEKLVGDATEDNGIVNGPKFAQAYQEHRSALSAMGVPQQTLARWDAIAKELKGYQFTKPSIAEGSGWMGASQIGRIAGGAMATTGALIAGHPELAGAAAVGTGVITLGPKMLLRYFMNPDGPNLLARALKTGKWAEPVGKAAGVSSKAAVLSEKKK